LREEDRLLKSVHNRLGFILHARAETSAGAQTVLDKEDFKVLVRELVSELVSDDIEATVNDVMEATTERLVLVSTPENGNQVRFDIRQLQEFFAGEFLYSGISSEELSERVEIISGDAHWREVIHFILSALIENQRTADLAVSVQALRKLNEGHESFDDRLYRRRMGRGVLIAQRLLTEGVLEQDLRDRQQIKPLLDTIGCIYDLDYLGPLTNLSPPRSRQWLINNTLIEKVETSNLEENLGVLFLLGFLLPNSNLNKEKVVRSYNQISLNHQELLLQRWWVATSNFDYENDDSEAPKLSEWLVEFVFDTLNSNRWLHYSSNLALSLVRILAHNHETLLTVCLNKGFSSQFAEVFFSIFGDNNWNKRGRNNTEIAYGRFSCSLYEYNWINKALPDFLHAFNQTEYLEKTNGFINLAMVIIDFSKTRSLSSLKTLIHLFDQATEARTNHLPADFMAIIPVEGRYSLTPFRINHLRNIHTESELTTLSSTKIPLPFIDFEFTKPKDTDSIETWKNLTFQLPKIVFLLLTLENHLSKEEKLLALPIISEVIEHHPILLLNNFHFLGVLQELDSELFRQSKDALKKMDILQAWNDGQIRFHHEISLPILKLPEDLNLLPIAARVLVNYVEIMRINIRIKIFSNDSVQEISLDELNEIANNVSHSYEIRSGALALSWIYTRDQDIEFEDLNIIKTQYHEFYYSGKQTWLSAVLVSCVLPSFSENNKIAIELINEILTNSLELKNHQEHFISLLIRLRETSLAPVTNKHLINKWLEYKFIA
jgi:hypothetical protein